MLRLIALVVTILLLLVSLTGCFSAQPKDIEAFSKPDEVVLMSSDYVLMPPDEIEIHCSKVPEIHLQRQRIRPDGFITFENLGSIQAANKTPDEVAQLIQAKVLELYALAGENPIDVQIASYQSKFYYVLGEVEHPGPKLITGRDTTFAAIAAATPTPLAWDKRVQVIRPSSDPNKKPKIFELNFKKMMAHGDLTKDVLLQQGDIVYIPPTILASLGKTVQEVTSPVNSTFSTINTVQRTIVGPSDVQSSN